MKIRTLIVDDEPDAREALTLTINNYCANDIDIIGKVATIKEAVQAINKQNPDLVLLDVDLVTETGFDLFDYFKEDYPFKVIFTTGYKDYAIKAFKYAALDYILKPVAPEELNKAINRYRKGDSLNQKLNIDTYISNAQNSVESKRKMVIPHGDGYDVVKLEDIIHCTGEANYTNILVSSGKKYLLAKSLRDIEELLPKTRFYRIHKSHIINMSYTKHIDKKKNEVLLTTGEKLPVAVRRLNNFLSLLQK
ncbi:MAG: LytTR family DNA-binding domain-containing protein [Salinivirgaceae bacterium]|nr:LytTR family DNA-binding domain-containing protein [Salinivirgaceae bacterium]